MKLIDTFILINSGNVIEMDDWKQAHAAIEKAIRSMSWPSESSPGVVIPKIITIKPGKTYTNLKGKVETVAAGEKKTLRNGVVPLRQLFRTKLVDAGWNAEEPLSLDGYFKLIREDKNLAQIITYPTPSVDAIQDPLHQGVGEFDFWGSSKAGFRTVVEWETGNISSSHRSINKMCLALMGGLVDAAVLIVPSNYLGPHLTDRIGNLKELQPYFYFWSSVGPRVKKGLLAVISVQQDQLVDSTDMREFIPRGEDGNAFRATKPKTKSSAARKRAKPPA